MTITECKTYIKGYNIMAKSKDEYEKIISAHEWIIPAQEVFRYDANNSPSPQGIKAQWNIPLMNTTSLMVGFPTSGHEITVLKNPIYTGMQMKVGNTFIPSEKFDTTGDIHLRD
jgi:hypothetical protein